MKSVTLDIANGNLPRLLSDAASCHEPIHITGGSDPGVLLSEEDWRSIEETLFLQSIPGMRESILEGMKAPRSEFVQESELDW